MSYEVTATKYRPQTFDDLVGQEFVAATLKNSIQKQEFANAFLLSGPRGVGKTSTARIIAKALNCESGPTGTPCNVCANCVSITSGSSSDVIEIDGASNTGINDVRVIQEEIQYPPVASSFKVYIIDEVHMLSKSAFNALLKTIEEPPAKVKFIFATTEINKVLATIKSRCQQFNFRLIPTDLLAESIRKVLDEKGVNYQNEALAWIAQEGKGSMRDAYTLLDQVVSFCGDDITLAKIQTKLGIIGEERIFALVTGITNNQHSIVFQELERIKEAGISPDEIVTEIIKYYRNLLFIKGGVQSYITNIDLRFYPKELADRYDMNDIENILEVSFKTYEKSRYSVDIETEVEIFLLKLMQYKQFIRPKEILRELAALQQNLLSPDFAVEKKNSEILENQNKQANTGLNIPPVVVEPQPQVVNSELNQPFTPQQTEPSRFNYELDRAFTPKPKQEVVENNDQSFSQPTVEKPSLNNVINQAFTPLPEANMEGTNNSQVSHVTVRTPNKSDILKALKANIADSEFMLKSALNNIVLMEESNKVITLIVAKEMDFQTLKDNLSFLQQEVNHNVDPDFRLELACRADLVNTAKTAVDINKENIIEIFNGKEII